jgi:hypothetical protein
MSDTPDADEKMKAKNLTQNATLKNPQVIIREYGKLIKSINRC